MKKFFRYLWLCRDNILFLWVFLFLLSLMGKNPHTTLWTIVMSGVCSISVTSIAILLAMFRNRNYGKN